MNVWRINEWIWSMNVWRMDEHVKDQWMNMSNERVKDRWTCKGSMNEYDQWTCEGSMNVWRITEPTTIESVDSCILHCFVCVFDRCAEFDVQQRLPVLCVIVTRGTQNAAHGEPLKRVALYLHLPGGMRAYPYNIPGVGQKHIYIYIYIYIIFGREFTMQNQQRVLSLIVASSGHHTQFTFQNHPCLGSRWPPLGIYTIYIYSVYIRYFWQGNHQIYGHIRSIYTVLANLKHISVTAFRSIGTLYYLRIPFTTCAWLFTSCPYPLLPAHTLYYLRMVLYLLRIPISCSARLKFESCSLLLPYFLRIFRQ